MSIFLKEGRKEKMGKLTNTQIKTLVNTAYNQFTGQTATTDELDLTAFTDNGENVIGENDREKFTGLD